MSNCQTGCIWCEYKVDPCEEHDVNVDKQTRRGTDVRKPPILSVPLGEAKPFLWALMHHYSSNNQLKVIRKMADNYHWSHAQGCRRDVLVQGQLITKGYSLLNHPGNRGDGLFTTLPFREGLENSKVAGLLRPS